MCSGLSTYENAGRRYCKKNNAEYISADAKGCKCKLQDGTIKKHKWNAEDEKIINFSFYGARGLI